MTIQVQAATPALLASAVRRFMEAESASTYLDSPAGLAFVAVDTEVVGWCWGYHLPRPDGTSMLYLHQLAVDDAHRRQGIGKALLQAFMTAGTKAGATKMFLTTAADNHPARALYDALGGGLAAQGPTSQLLVSARWDRLMKYVNVEFTESGTFSDPRAYLERLPSLAPSLPANARAFATDPEHYNFAGKRCVKDLKPQRLTSGETNGRPWLELELKHNCWKHDDDLSIRYTGVQSVVLDPPGEPTEVARLQGVLLDEILPTDRGCTHEFTCLAGSLVVACEDLTATWIDSNCPENQ